jgi:hypothetical protein
LQHLTDEPRRDHLRIRVDALSRVDEADTGRPQPGAARSTRPRDCPRTCARSRP